MTNIYLLRTRDGFRPADADAVAAAKGFAVDEIYKAKITKPRSYQHHKLVMALLGLTYKNLPEKYENHWSTFLAFRKAIAIESGYCENIVSSTGEVYRIPKSLSYDALDEIEFAEVASAMIRVCAKILDMSAPDLAEELSGYAGFEGYEI